MKIIDILNSGKRTVSFEFFPPKTDKGFDDLFEAIEALKPLNPSYVSVTYGAGGSTRRKTIELVSRIKHEIGIESMAHLTCVGSTREDMAEVLASLTAVGVENLIPLRGDPPKGEEAFKPTPGGFAYANELVAFVRGSYPFCMAAACYPEKHPEATSANWLTAADRPRHNPKNTRIARRRK
jgi:methylenetetrahydrofolate reductase (NADPH)